MALVDLEGLSDLAAILMDRARRRGVYALWRAQERRIARVVVRRGRAEETSHVTSSGHGLQVVTQEGFTALASRDDFDETRAVDLLDRVVGAASRGASLGLTRSAAPRIPPLVARDVPTHVDAFAAPDLGEIRRRLVELESEIAGKVPGPATQIAFGADLDAWRIFRSDGTDVLFAMPRCTLRLSATAGNDDGRHAVGASVSGPSPDLLFDSTTIRRFLRRAERAARLARELPDAPPFPAGTHPLVIDYALAKGMAHEAFGHAAEADGFRSSVLAREGRFREGERVGPDHVSIVDEPIAGDHAWQPFSANGARRERAVIVDRGILRDALCDPWSAGAAGVAPTGAARAESFRSAPQPRMTNIRIETTSPLDAPGEFEDYGPEEVRDLLLSAGVLDRHPRLAFLSGYAGGQVNTAIGEFVFHCRAIYALDRDRVVLHRPAIFSGSMFGALGAVRESFGPLLLDAIGTCGKWGQNVPSSGGSHWFLVLDPDPSIRLGGR